jgi:riboflavin synthase
VFTGLIEDIGTVERLGPSGGMTDVWVASRLGAHEPYVLGESIAVDGACLTVVEARADGFRVQAAPETLRRTTLGGLRPGAKVNLERAMKLSDRLGGHLVAGHVDAVARVLETGTEGGSWTAAFELPAQLAPYFIEKGSVTVDGISLTVNAVEPGLFRVQLIPETQARTRLAHKKAGDRVNLEADLVGKYVARMAGLGLLRPAPSSLTETALTAAGFTRGHRD